MTPSELARKVRYIQLHTRRAVNDLLAGEYTSAFKGTGMEFEEVREYQPGDDVKAIDWNVTAKQGRPYIKRFREERELTVMFAVDLSASGAFGSSAMTKNDLSAELCAMLALSAVKSNDKVGMAIFTDTVERFIPPAKGSANALRLVREILAFRPQGTGTDISSAIDTLGRVLRRRAVVFFISDFQDDGYMDRLAAFARKHDVIAITVADPEEAALPDVGLIQLQDAETGEEILLDSGSANVRKHFSLASRLQTVQRDDAFRSAGIDQILLNTHEDYAKKLITFFKTREHRR